MEENLWYLGEDTILYESQQDGSHYKYVAVPVYGLEIQWHHGLKRTEM